MIVQHYVAWVPWACCHAFGHPAIEIRGDVGAADALHLLIQHALHQVTQPVLIYNAVIIGVCHDFSAGHLRADVTRYTKPLVFLMIISNLWKLSGDSGDSVGGAIVHNDHLMIGVIQSHQGLQTLHESPGSIVSANHHRYTGQSRVLVNDARNPSPHFFQYRSSRLFAAIGSRHPEEPICDLVPTGEPVVGESENHRTRQAVPEDALHVLRQYFRLPGFRLSR